MQIDGRCQLKLIQMNRSGLQDWLPHWDRHYQVKTVWYNTGNKENRFLKAC